jgi:iron complex outermembrane receptor protein
MRPVKARLIALAASLLVSISTALPIAAQVGDVVGHVRGGESFEPLFGANVLVTSLRDPSYRVTRLADRSGRFRIENLPEGRYEIRASYVGYTTFVIDAVEVTKGITVNVDLWLEVEPLVVSAVVISASRREEKVLDAPAAIHVLDGERVRARPVLTPADHLQAVPSVDVVRTGLTQSNVVLRGFNNVFSGTTLLLVDNRIARVPSLRYNAWNLLPTTNEDLERLEMVSGPGSALYGPNCANGVVHAITRPPIDSEGTTLSIAGGDRSTALASVRHAGKHTERVGWKVTAHWLTGEDFSHVDPVEKGLREGEIADGADPDTLKIGARDEDVEKIGFEGRLDARVSHKVWVVLNGGFSRLDSIELTGLGAAQVKNWSTAYGQARLNWRDLFLQTYVNRSDAGDTYNLRTGLDFVDRSTLVVGQAQHQWSPSPRRALVYGVDALLTRPETDATINGRNEEDDDINEIGAYVQAETYLTDRWSVVAAARIDDHNRLDDPVFSPRAAVVFGPTSDHKLRATYNRAYSTPTSNNLFLDLVTERDLGDLGAAMGMEGYDLWAKGVPEGGFHFRRDGDGGLDGLYMQVPLALGGAESTQVGATALGPHDHVPASAHLVWQGAVKLLLEQSQGRIDLTHTLSPGNLPGEGIGTVLRALNPSTGTFDPVSPDAVRDVGEMDPTITNTFEIGYKGAFGKSFSATIDVHYDRINDFIGPLRVETPNVFFDPTDPELAGYLATAGVPADSIPIVIDALARIPVGTVTPDGNDDPADPILTYRNFGSIDLTGIDVGCAWAVDPRWTIEASYSFTSRDVFRDVEGGLDVSLNAPRHKAGGTLRYVDADHGLDAGARLRFVDGFPVESGVFVGEIGYYVLLDLDASWRVPASPSTVLSVRVLNVLDDEHREFVGAPELGRVGILRLSHSF